METPPIPWTRYVAIGDSVTEGLMDARPDGSYAGWADRLAAVLRERRLGRPFQYANLAIRGRLLSAILTEQLPQALALQPDLVSLWGGGNDTLRPNADPDRLAAAVEDAVVTIRATGADVLIGLGVDSGGTPVLELTRGRAAVYSANLWSIARRTGARVLDVWGMRSLHDPRMWADDRIHFSSEGHRRVAECALVGLGLEPSDPDWDRPAEPRPPASRTERLRADSVWAREHMLPWIGRRLRRTSSGAGRTAKRPTLEDVADADLVPPAPQEARPV
ncbi:SGNH/GDSL hydrolase family protein [Propionicicella superfundia]|uniref:SGNH/GDSL hydrolase family protein n=1 Tax=Propionicicella superfundia TaxID=348582 RepID=UPI00068701CF|nr:SGNH/GDSL hydrolase family protein [Propionicicella superfundia]